MVNVERESEAGRYRRQGFAMGNRLPPREVAKLQLAVERVIAANPNWRDLLRAVHIPRSADHPEGVIGGEDIFPFAVDNTILDAVSALIGPDIIFWSAQLFAKPAGDGKSVPWHQDAYTPIIKPGKPGDLVTSLSVWIAIDDCDVGNGCLRFVPETGRSGLVKHTLDTSRSDRVINFEVDAGSRWNDSAVDVVMTAGGFSIHDMYVVHGSNANHSKRRRVGLSFLYFAAHDYYDRDTIAHAGATSRSEDPGFGARPIWLVRGENRHAANDFRRGHGGLEELDLLADTARDAYARRERG